MMYGTDASVRRIQSKIKTRDFIVIVTKEDELS